MTKAGRVCWVRHLAVAPLLLLVTAIIAAPNAHGQDALALRARFAAIEHYPRQLHELERDDYLRIKRGELARQRAMFPK